MGLLRDIDFSALLSPDNLRAVGKIAVTIVIGYLLIRLLALLIGRLLKRRATEQVQMLVRKTIIYVGVAVLVVVLLSEMGMELAPLLGAAGILGLAVGIASQTSLSNIIAGAFLVSEQPFAVGDVIRIGEKAGIVQSIDLLSVKVRTFDNLYIRIPNEKIIGGELTNITRFPIRRMDLDISVAYKEDLERVREILIEIAANERKVLNEPAPLVLFKNFGDSGIEILFAVWFAKADFLEVKNSVFLAVKKRFDEEGIEIPFPHRTIYAGKVTDPFPVKMDSPSSRQKAGK